MKDNLIGKELDQEEIDIIQEYANNGKLHPDWFPLITYDLVQCGYPFPDHGEMIARNWGGTDSQDRLMSGNGMWCKTDDVKKLLEQLKNVF